MAGGRLIRLAVCCGMLAGIPAAACPGETETWRDDIQHESRMRVGEIVRGLDDGFQLRRRQVEELVALSRTSSQTLVYEQLIEALGYPNAQIREGVVEVMVRIGDPRFTLQIAQMLPFENIMDIRRLGLRMLPVFCVPGEQARRELIQLYFTDISANSERQRELLRARPLRRGSWELDPDIARIRERVENVLAGQLDPIARLLAGLDMKARRAQSIELLQQLAGTSFGETTDDARESWRARRRTFALRNDMLVVETETIAARTLADMGALSAAGELRELGLVERPGAATTALGALAELSRHAYSLAARAPLELRDRRPDAQETAWRAEEMDNAAAAVEETWLLSSALVDNAHDLVRLYAYEALGATRRPEAVPLLRSASIRSGNTPDMRARICRALAEVGGVQAVEVLALLTNYRGYSTDVAGRREEYQVVLAAIQGLSDIAGRPGDEGGAAALDRLVDLFANTRGIPDHPTIREQALSALQSGFARVSTSDRRDDWKRFQAECRAARAGQQRPAVLRKSAPEVSLEPSSSGEERTSHP